VTGAVAVVPRGGRIVAVLGIVLVALSMRNAVPVIGPVFPEIADELGLDIVVLSFIGAAPPIGFALAGLVVPALTRRWGLEATLIVALAAMIVGQGVRAASGEAVLLVLSTGIVMIGIGALNVLLPPLVRRYFPERIGSVTSLYLVVLGIGVSLPAFTVVQIAESTGWRVAIGVWLLVPVLALAPWLSMLRAPRPPEPIVVEFDDGVEPLPVAAPPRRHVAASPTVWAITAAFGVSSISAYVAMAFLPSMLIAVGISPAVAGIAIGIALAVGIPQALLVPPLATRSRTVVPMIAVAGLCGFAGWTGMLLAPAGAPYLWGALIGLAPITFPLSLVLVNSRTRSHRVTVSVSAFVQGVAYVAAGLFALAVGVIHDATGSWVAPIILLLASTGLALPAILILRRGRFVDDEIDLSPRRAPRR
jgi:CP family cyanate transporter-like MFS transporter